MEKSRRDLPESEFRWLCPANYQHEKIGSEIHPRGCVIHCHIIPGYTALNLLVTCRILPMVYINASACFCILRQQVASCIYCTIRGMYTYRPRWSLANELGLVVVALYQKSLQLQYVEGLVDNIKRVRTLRHAMRFSHSHYV